MVKTSKQRRPTAGRKMIFEYDPEKSRTNKTKDGIDFEEVKAGWGDPNAVESASEYGAEERIARTYRFDRSFGQ
jgi:uncharacterized DUF497 family protein